MSHSLWFNFWPSFLFVIFPEWAKSNSAGSKVFLLLLPFLQLLVLVPRGTVPLHCERLLWAFSFFLLDLQYLRRTYLPFVSCVFLAFSFELSYSCLSYAIRLGDLNSALLCQFFFPLRIWTFFLFVFLHRLLGSSFYGFWALSLLGLPPLFIYLFIFYFIFYGPLCYSFRPGCCDFLDLNIQSPELMGCLKPTRE